MDKTPPTELSSGPWPPEWVPIPRLERIVAIQVNGRLVKLDPPIMLAPGESLTFDVLNEKAN